MLKRFEFRRKRSVDLYGQTGDTGRELRRERSQNFEHFGRASEFAVVDISDDGRIASLTSERNMGEHFGGHGVAENLVIRISPDALVVKGMGPRGLAAFDSSGIAVFLGSVNSVSEAIEAYVGRGLASGRHEAS